MEDNNKIVKEIIITRYTIITISALILTKLCSEGLFFLVVAVLFMMITLIKIFKK